MSFTNKFSQSKLVTKYLSKAEIKILNGLNVAIKEDNVVVTCVGLYNHGKSTLLNALIGDFDNKIFKTADIRETTKNKKVKYKNFTFVDTPGLNAQKNDDKRVMDAVKQSDINLFVHTVTTGEFTEKEIEFLNKVKKYWKNPQEFINRTIFVVSRIDKANNEDDIIKTVAKMSKQILEIFDSKATIISVSAIRYTKGRIENKKLMIKKSNILILEKTIENLSKELLNSIRKTRKLRLEKQYNDLIKKFSSKVQENKLEINKQKQAQKKYLDLRNRDIKKIEHTLKNMYSQIEEV